MVFFTLKQPAILYIHIVWHHIDRRVVQYKRDSLKSTTQTSTASVRIPSRSSRVHSTGEENSDRCLQEISLFFRSHFGLVGASAAEEVHSGHTESESEIL